MLNRRQTLMTAGFALAFSGGASAQMADKAAAFVKTTGE